ncbi:MAG: hypothetical protein J6Y04_10840 [Bacteroidaceae bacterium]|nr:hypothetical protein [Bacteroidaceae bacterium]
MKTINRFIVPLLLTVALAIMGWLVLRTETDVLYRLQELSLWLPTRHFFETSIIYPGGVLTWLSAFMTQFFYHPLLGMTLMLICWGLIMILLCWQFHLRGPWRLLALLVPLALLACLVQTGYWLYYMKLQGHAWVPTMGVLLSCLLAIVHLLLPNRWAKLLWLLVVGLLGYPLMGAWWVLAVALMIVPRHLRMDKAEAINVAIGLALVILVPPIMVQQFYGQVQLDTAYLAAMPSFQFGQTDCNEYRYAYYALASAFVICAVPGLIYRNSEPAYKELRLSWVVSLLCIALACWGVTKRWERDTNFHKEVAMNNAIERLDWEGVLRISLDQEMGEPMPPTRVMVMMKNLALFRLGRIGDEMFRYPEGAEQQHAPWQVRMTQVGGKLLYYHYGKEGFCYRWCMEDGVEFGWSVDVLKYMTKTSLLTHDWEVARKYINILKKTLYHKEWAEKHEAYIQHPELMAEDEEMKPIIPMAAFPDRLDGDNTLVEMYLLKTFSSGHGAEPRYQEMTLICALIMKDIDLFWPRFHQYLNMHQKEEGFHVPRYYQEAAYLYSMLEPQRPSDLWPGLTNAEALQRVPFDESVKQSYQQFMDFNVQCGSMTEDQKRVAFLPQFGDTFYYFYFLRRNQKTN